MTRYSLLLLLLAGCGKPKDYIEISTSPVQQESEVALVGHHWETQKKSLVKWEEMNCSSISGKYRVCMGTSVLEDRMDAYEVPDFLKKIIDRGAYDISVSEVSERRLVHDDWEDVKP